MSYCRWSSDDFQCDVYVYEHVHGGWTTYVAGRRCVLAEPLPAPVSLQDDPDAWFARRKRVMEMVDAAELVDIGLPHDGESFSDLTPNDCADRLEGLRAMGYVVPQYAIDALREEAA
jgi:hypothetical protein